MGVPAGPPILQETEMKYTMVIDGRCVAAWTDSYFEPLFDTTLLLNEGILVVNNQRRQVEHYVEVLKHGVRDRLWCAHSNCCR